MKFYNTQTAGRITYTGGDGDAPYDCHGLPTKEPGNLTKYCLAVRFQACAVKQHCPINGTCTSEDQLKLATYFSCSEGVPYTTKGKTSFEDDLPCAKASGLDVDAIMSCFDPDNVRYDSEPALYIAAVSNDTATANVTFFPDLRTGAFPGKEVPAVEPKAWHNVPALIRTICSEYKGSSKPAACNSSSLDDQVLQNAQRY